jgi:hypothetical protein
MFVLYSDWKHTSNFMQFLYENPSCLYEISDSSFNNTVYTGAVKNIHFQIFPQ